jgi:sterol 3beta-glucosyltransferase
MATLRGTIARVTRTIVLLAGGTLGDVAPFVALGRGLREAGARARVVAHAPFAPLVRAHGLECAELGPDPGELLNADPAALTLDDGPLATVRASLGYVRRAQPLYARMLTAAWQACRDASALLVALPTLWGVDIAEALGVPLVVAPLQPLTPTSAWPSALLPFTRSLGPHANRLSHRLLGMAIWLPWRAIFGRWRARELQLAPARGDHLARALAAGVPFVYGFSPWLVPPPQDWPGNHTVSGHWTLPGAAEGPPAELVRFLANGPPPVYVGFGSMGARRPHEDAALAVEAARRAGRRLVLLGGPAAQAIAHGSPAVCVVERAPHSWLFQHVAAVFHHGGAGTTHAALRAGVPTAALPVAADQYFWGARIAMLGAGPPPVARHTLDAPRLAELMHMAGNLPEYRRRAAALGALLRAEDGVARSVEVVRGLI